MAMPLKDLSALRGCMARTVSENDPEALAAIRAANRILLRNGYTWEHFFKRTVTIVNAVEPAEEAAADEELEDAFRIALDDARPGSYRDTLLSIQAQFERVGSITTRQRAFVMDAAARTGRRR